MTTITFLGGEETDNPAKLAWGRFTFIYDQPVECNDPHIIAKARKNRFFRVSDEAGSTAAVTPADRMAAARAAKAAKRASEDAA